MQQDLDPIKPDIKPGELVVCDDGEYSNLMDTARFNQAWRVAKLFSESKLVPAHFQGSTASVFVALHMAMRMRLDPMLVMQNTYLIGGRPGMEAKLIIGLVNARGPFKGPIQWDLKGEGKQRECTAYAFLRETGEYCEATVTWDMVEKEGWASKSGSKWQTIPDLMFRYRSAAFLARLYCPEVILGLSTVDELEDVTGEVVDLKAAPAQAAPEKPSQADKIKEHLKGRSRATRGVETAEPDTSPVPEPESPTALLTPEQGREIEELMKEAKVTENAMRTKWGFGLADLEADHYEAVRNWIGDKMAEL